MPRSTHCANGHPRTPENTYVVLDKRSKPYLRCRTCHRLYQRRRRYDPIREERDELATAALAAIAKARARGFTFREIEAITGVDRRSLFAWINENHRPLPKYTAQVVSRLADPANAESEEHKRLAEKTVATIRSSREAGLRWKEISEITGVHWQSLWWWLHGRCPQPDKAMQVLSALSAAGTETERLRLAACAKELVKAQRDRGLDWREIGFIAGVRGSNLQKWFGRGVVPRPITSRRVIAALGGG